MSMYPNVELWNCNAAKRGGRGGGGINLLFWHKAGKKNLKSGLLIKQKLDFHFHVELRALSFIPSSKLPLSL